MISECTIQRSAHGSVLSAFLSMTEIPDASGTCKDKLADSLDKRIHPESDEEICPETLRHMGRMVDCCEDCCGRFLDFTSLIYGIEVNVSK
jgi:hypothetical protein